MDPWEQTSLKIQSFSFTKMHLNTSSAKWRRFCREWDQLTHWSRVTHIWVGKLTIIGSDNGLSPERRPAIIWTNAGIVLIGPLETNFSEILIEIHTFSLKKMRLKMSSAKCCSFPLDLNELKPARSAYCKIWDINTELPLGYWYIASHSFWAPWRHSRLIPM